MRGLLGGDQAAGEELGEADQAQEVLPWGRDGLAALPSHPFRFSVIKEKLFF